MPTLHRRTLLASAAGASLAWAQPARSQPRQASVADTARFVVTDPLPMPGLGRERRVRIYLPPSYAAESARRYPVVYFHDGQNVFDAATSYAGEWGADELLDELARERGFEAIAVGIDNGAERRMRELNPWNHERFGTGEGWAYLRFVVETVKPFVDQRYRTHPQAAHTALVGSSMGGLITHAALHRHRDVFGMGGVLSPAYWLALPFIERLTLDEPLHAKQRVFVYAGGKESADMVPNARKLAGRLAQQSGAVRFLEVPDAQHNEAAWRAVLPQVLAHWMAGI